MLCVSFLSLSLSLSLSHSCESLQVTEYVSAEESPDDREYWNVTFEDAKVDSMEMVDLVQHVVSFPPGYRGALAPAFECIDKIAEDVAMLDDADMESSGEEEG